MKSVAALVNSPEKLVYLTLGVLFLMLGLIGLIIPIIPGILFLFAAVFVLGKVSRRVRRWSEGNDTYRTMSTRFDRMGRVGFLDRLKVMGLMIAGSAARGLDVAVVSVSRLYARAVR